MKKSSPFWSFDIVPISLGLLLIGINSCHKKDNYPDTPVITFKNLIHSCINNSDSAYLYIGFTDGNGDIGYDAQDASAPFDFYAIEFWDSSGTWESTGDTLKYHIPDITPPGSDKSLNGQIEISFPSIVYDPMINNKPIFPVVRFNVWIYDRSGNKSNVITTSSITTGCN